MMQLMNGMIGYGHDQLGSRGCAHAGIGGSRPRVIVLYAGRPYRTCCTGTFETVTAPMEVVLHVRVQELESL